MCDSNSLRKGLRVLVVDGDADSRDLLMALFEDYEVSTTTATCVSEALESMQQACPDLLISEIVLPGEDGYSLMSQVKAWKTTQRTRIPAIALTVCAEESAQRRAIAAGFCQHLPKPLDIDELIATMACLTQETQETAETASYAKL
ncbi:response regulator [Trichocoleus sp. FACHB-262]|uniref:response regulator n=1 Tax=Trichocoleus sp. FACHB-262 TaxID=2692869 RepID=UPI0016886016|nr:response regulator [Trichocoleus sp. FACHB-262]MBD2121843.1 response regulator [Trichocoleus sp. FACHB-262]